MNIVTQNIIDQTVSRFEVGESPASIKKWISEQTGFKKTKSNEIYNEIIKSATKEESDIFDFEIENQDKADKPFFNTETRKYVVFIKSLGRNIVVSEEKHKKILQMYSDWDGEAKTLNEVCRNIQWPRAVLVEYLKKFEIGHDSLPITNEDLDSTEDEELLSRLRELRKFNLYQRLEREGWDEVKRDAHKWRGFVNGQLDPFRDAIKGWKPPVRKNFLGEVKSKGLNTLCCVLSDVHFGGFTKPNLTFRKISLSSDIIATRITNLADRIVFDAKTQNLQGLAVLMIGDILNSANSEGTTNRGTMVEGDLKGAELFKFALDKMVLFFDKLLSLKLPVDIYGLTGNHDAALGSGLLYALEAYYKDEHLMRFNVSDRYIDYTTINNSLVCFTHGSHWSIKTKTPPASRAKLYGQSLFLQAQREFPNCHSRYLITADKHHQSILEHNDFQYILVPSLVGGDSYSDALNLNSRACQQTFLFDETGIKSINNYYFEK